MHKFKFVTALAWYYLCVVQGPCRLPKPRMNMKQFIMNRLGYRHHDHDVNNEIEESSCRTPNGDAGSCISLYDCSPLLVIVSNPNKTPQDINTLRQSQCGFQGQTPKVCCPQATPAPSDVCFTPDAKEGRCISLYKCPHITQMLQPPVSKENIAFVQSSKCQGADQYSVCCGPPPNLNPPPPGPPNRICSPTAAPPDPRSGCCGVESFTGDRIVGGNATSLDQYPWMALIEYSQNNRIKLLCGGALISGKYVLTAAHCVVGSVLEIGTPRNIRLGEYDTSNSANSPDCIIVPGGGEDCTQGATVIPIEKIIPHADYNYRSSLKRHDIALIRMRQFAPYNDFIRPICLPQTDVTANPPPDFKLYAAGWGAVNNTHSKSSIKLHVDLPYVSIDQCQRIYSVPRRNVQFWNGQLCAGGEEGKDSCKGDSGGPLMYENGRTFELIGIVSFGSTPCGLEDIPGVYTKVFEYSSWIRSNIKP